MTLSARMTTTALSVASKPSSSWSGGHGERSVRSARHRVYRPGWPRPANDTAPGQPPPTLFMTRRTARPMAAFACQPGPSAPKPAFMPIAPATGPQTTRSGVTFSSVVWTPRRLKAGSAIARTAASTTGRCSGRQPAMTALTATFSTVARPLSGSSAPRTSPGASGAQESASSTRPRVGATIGRPSVQPRR